MCNPYNYIEPPNGVCLLVLRCISWLNPECNVKIKMKDCIISSEVLSFVNVISINKIKIADKGNLKC